MSIAGFRVPAYRARRRLVGLVTAGCLAGSGLAQATDLLGLYVGAGAVRSTVKVDNAQFGSPSTTSPLGFSTDNTGWTGFVGVRPFSLLGFEAGYVDFGHGSETVSGVAARADARGESVLALGYLPIPIPMTDLFVKAGVARVERTLNGETSLSTFCLPGCGAESVRYDETHTGVSWGLGGQVTVASWAVRAEYQRVQVPNGTPSVAEVSLIWRF